VSERKKREGVRLSIAFLKGKRTESHECRLSKLVATLCRSKLLFEEWASLHRAAPDRKRVGRRISGERRVIPHESIAPPGSYRASQTCLALRFCRTYRCALARRFVRDQLPCL
jgi:hypothetical protein